ncbi:hypothetical protein P7C73_g5411, partial [Tremellales sp. Uapishka_1]
MIPHVKYIDPNLPDVEIELLVGGASEAPLINNQALAASRAGDHRLSIKLHRQALAIKIAAFGENSVHSAITLNGLGEELLEVGELDEAETVLKKAYAVRKNLGPGQAFDRAVTGENLGRVYEAEGDWEKARKIREEGGAEGVACSNYHVGVETTLSRW